MLFRHCKLIRSMLALGSVSVSVSVSELGSELGSGSGYPSALGWALASEWVLVYRPESALEWVLAKAKVLLLE